MGAVVVGVVGAEPGRGRPEELTSIFGLGTDRFFSLAAFGALRGGAAGRCATLLIDASVGLGLMSFSGCFGGASSAFLLVPFVDNDAAGKPGREPGLLTPGVGRGAFALAGLACGFGGAGDLSLPMELRISPKRLILDSEKEWVRVVGRVRDELGRSGFYVSCTLFACCRMPQSL